ncbi:MAG: MdtA/MuxA family multidrug efflux RND transporter periplasmic adaptor subunit [Lacunisphaera sp.]
MSDLSRSSATPPSTKASPNSPKGVRWTTWLILIGIVAVIAYAVVVRPMLNARAAGPAAAGGRGGHGFGSGPTPVTAATARESDLTLKLVALGTVTPVRTVTVRSRVDGELQQILFTEGQMVVAGTPFAELDPRPFQVQKLQAEAQLAKDQALLENAQVDLKRFQTLLAQDSVAEQQVATQVSLVHQYAAALKVDQAQIESANLQLTYAHIITPISGRVGLRQVDQGNIVHSSDANGIAVITQLQPITVLFSIPQSAIPQVQKTFATGEAMPVVAYDRDGKTKVATGHLVTIDNQIDPTTGSVKLRAEFTNEDDALFPNQFVNVELTVGTLKNATVIPGAAVQIGSAGSYVYVVKDGKTVVLRQVETGAVENSRVAITKGLVPGEVVVVDGVDKLRDGAAVDLVQRSTGPAATGEKTKPAGGWGNHSGKAGSAKPDSPK